MADKMECPGCGSYSSSVLGAVRDGDPCPSCGLSAAAIVEISMVREAKADEQLKQQLEQAINRADRATARVATVDALFRELESVLERYRSRQERV